MNALKNENLIHAFIICLSMVIFFFSGFFHLAQFETTDEHLWKYDRIPQYWHALASHDWAKTYINDKPGVTVALFSGIGLIFEPHPEDQFPDHYVSDPLFEKYDPQKTLSTNFIFRLPVLIVATFSLLGFYFLIRVAFTGNVALLATILLATNPILIGMSQIINPDSFFWIFGGLAICAHIAFAHTHKKKFLILCGILTGFAFLSKYTAFTLFVFFTLYEFGHAFFSTDHHESSPKIKNFLPTIKDLIIILLIACGIFIFFIPAVFTQPDLLFKGIAQFLTVKKMLIGITLIGIIGTVFFLGKKRIDHAIVLFHTRRRIMITFTASIFLFIVAFNMINVWTDQKMIPFDDLRDAVYANEPQSFNFKPFLTEDAKIVKKGKAFFLEAYPLIFSLTPIILIIIIGGTTWSLRKRTPHAILPLTFTITAFLCAYFILTVAARVVVNVRYSIILYPILTLWASLILFEFCKHIKISSRSFYIYATFLLAIGSLTLWQLRPFYFSYTNFLLPQQFSIHDSWGHGSYEAAQYLNDLPNAETLIIWSNSDTVCRFFVGKCLRSRKIDLMQVTPDYFVISKRGTVKERNHFVLENNPQPKKDADYYFTNLHKLAIWILQINDRPDNYMIIIPYEKN